MPVSAGMITHLAQSPTFLCELWKMAAADGTVAAYCSHTRDLVFGGTTYKACPAEPSQSVRQIGLEPDTSDLAGAFDTTITEQDVIGGRWKKARIERYIVCYTDLTLGYARKQVGYAGAFQIENGQYTVEFQSLSSLLSQTVGDLTSPTDRRRRLDEAGISMAAHTHARTVSAVTSRRVFTVGGSAQADGYFKYGLAVWGSGANSGLEMEIKNNTGNVIELQLPMRSTIANGDGVTLKRGYDGTRTQAKLIDADLVAGMEAEPDLPGIRGLITYPGA